MGQIVEEDINHWRGVERQYLTYQQPANHRDSQRPAQLRTKAAAKRQGQTAE